MSFEADSFKRELLSFRENVLELEVAMSRKGFDKAKDEEEFLVSMPASGKLAVDQLALDLVRRKKAIYNQHLTVATRILDNFDEHFREHI